MTLKHMKQETELQRKWRDKLKHTHVEHYGLWCPEGEVEGRIEVKMQRI